MDDKIFEQQNQAIIILEGRLKTAEQEINRLNLMLEFEKSETAEWKVKFSNLTQEMKGK